MKTFGKLLALLAVLLLAGGIFGGGTAATSTMVAEKETNPSLNLLESGAKAPSSDDFERRAKEDRKLERKKDDPGYRKLWEKEAKRKLLHHEEKVDPEYRQILQRLKREGLNLTELFREMEHEIRSSGKKIDKVEFAREFEKRELKNGETSATATSQATIALSTTSSCTNVGPGTPGRYDTDRIYYDPLNEEAYVDVRDRIKFYLTDANYIGLGEWVHLYNGSVIDFTWTGYYEPESEVNWILSYLEDNYGITSDEVEQIHMKYFINAKDAYDMKHLDDNEWVWLGDRDIELWSEANYYPNNPVGDRWENYGYPDENEGGVDIIEDNRSVDTSAGFSYHNAYPECTYRHFGGGSETGIELTIYSHPWHQESIVQ